MAFNIGLSGIRAASTDLEVTGNNVANASTVGFKESRAEFVDIYKTSLLGTGQKPVGSGVMVDNIRQEFSQGNISGTENVLDMAIDGNGFFILDGNGSVAYTRAGMFSLDKNGFVVANTGARLQGYTANEDGLVNGVLGDINIEISNQPPRLTSLAAAVVNLDAGQPVLQEQGLQLIARGLAVGVADSGIPESTATVLNSVGQPTTGGTPAQVTFDSTVSAVAASGYSGETLDINLGEGLGPQTITLGTVAAGAPNQAVLNDIQAALDATFGSQELRALEDDTTGQLVIQRAGFAATDGTSFTITSNAGWDAVFDAPGTAAVVGGTEGVQLFIGSNPLNADFRSVPGTQTTTRTTQVPPLNIVSSDPGQYAELTADNIYSALDISNGSGNSLAFRAATEEGGAPYQIILSEAAWTGAAPASYSSVSVAEVVAEINNQITATAGAGNEEILAVNNGGRIEFQVQPPADPGEFVQIADNAVSSSGLDLTDLGFLSGNRLDNGVEPIQANNQFDIEVLSTSGNPGGPYTITIPPASYANLEALAEAIQAQIDFDIGSGGIADKVSVQAIGGQLVFTNTRLGSTEGLALTASAAEPQALTALGFDRMFVVTGQDELDRSNSFRINLSVPAPDVDNRSGSVEITLDEEFRSVQQLAAAINRQLNSQDSDGYIGVKATAVAIEPQTVPPQYKLELQATEAGEASVVSITNITASGVDVSEADLFGILQADPGDNSLLTVGVEGVSNRYPEQRVTIIDPDGLETEVVIPEYAEANEIVAQFNQQPGVTASAVTEMTIPAIGYNSPGNDMK
ncbi:MAG: flagellar hook-basal body complex protein, partial [Pseudomonadota bacterium]|nr:flagellar hook-basal body complex protein [Pseudomonadota bacterium]